MPNASLPLRLFLLLRHLVAGAIALDQRADVVLLQQVLSVLRVSDIVELRCGVFASVLDENLLATCWSIETEMSVDCHCVRDCLGD